MLRRNLVASEHSFPKFILYLILMILSHVLAILILWCLHPQHGYSQYNVRLDQLSWFLYRFFDLHTHTGTHTQKHQNCHKFCCRTLDSMIWKLQFKQSMCTLNWDEMLHEQYICANILYGSRISARKTHFWHINIWQFVHFHRHLNVRSFTLDAIE